MNIPPEARVLEGAETQPMQQQPLAAMALSDSSLGAPGSSPAIGTARIAGLEPGAPRGASACSCGSRDGLTPLPLGGHDPQWPIGLGRIPASKEGISARFLSVEDRDLTSLSSEEFMALSARAFRQAQASNERDRHWYSHGCVWVEPGFEHQLPAVRSGS